MGTYTRHDVVLGRVLCIDDLMHDDAAGRALFAALAALARADNPGVRRHWVDFADDDTTLSVGATLSAALYPWGVTPASKVRTEATAEDLAAAAAALDAAVSSLPEAMRPALLALPHGTWFVATQA